MKRYIIVFIPEIELKVVSEDYTYKMVEQFINKFSHRNDNMCEADSPDELLIELVNYYNGNDFPIGYMFVIDTYKKKIIRNLSTINNKASKLAAKVINILDVKARAGCYSNSSWEGFQNGNGTEVGIDIERLISFAKKLNREI